MNQAGKTVLSFQTILSGGDEPYKELEVPEILIDGVPGVVYLKHPTAGDILDFAELKAGAAENDPKNNETMLTMISKCIVDKNGYALFKDKDEVRQLQLPIFTRFMNAVNNLSGSAQKEALGKDSAPAAGDSSPSN